MAVSVHVSIKPVVERIAVVAEGQGTVDGNIVTDKRQSKKSGVDGYQGFYFDRAPYSVDNYSLEYLFRLSESARNNKSVIPFQMYIEYAKTINKLDSQYNIQATVFLSRWHWNVFLIGWRLFLMRVY